jgi:hypothetical protein
VNPVDDLLFAVRLVKAKLKSVPFGDPVAFSLDIGKSLVTVDVRLTFAEQTCLIPELIMNRAIVKI